LPGCYRSTTDGERSLRLQPFVIRRSSFATRQNGRSLCASVGGAVLPSNRDEVGAVLVREPVGDDVERGGRAVPPDAVHGRGIRLPAS